MDDHHRISHWTKNVSRAGKRENAVVAPGKDSYYSGPTNSDVFLSCISQNYEAGVNMSYASNFTQQRRWSGLSQTPQGSLRILRNRCNVTLQQESAYQHWPNNLLPANSLAQCFQTANNVTHLGNTIGTDGGCLRYTCAIPILHGRCLSSGAIGMASVAVLGYKDVKMTAPLPYFFEDQRLVQDMQVHSHVDHINTEMPAFFYQHPLKDLQARNLYPSSDFHLGPRFLSFPSTCQIYMPPVQLARVHPGVGRGRMRSISLENDVPLNLSGVHEVGTIIDEHRDMRLDIDSMSYEELLVLEEQIGDVNTGFTDEFISENLKSIIHVPDLVSSPSDNETCVICQVEYKAGDSLGTLSCSHKYHWSCIKQWLLIKNLCPICKTSALALERRDG